MHAVTRQFGLGTIGLMLAALAAGCSQQGGGWLAGNDPIPQIHEFPIHYAKAGKYCGAKQPLRLVVRDQAHMAFVPVGDVPVDFDRQMVLFVTMGQVYSESYGVSIDRVWQHNNLVRVGVTETFPAAGEMSFPTPCSPYALAVVPKSDANVDGFVTEITPPTLEGSRPEPAPNPSGRNSRRP